MNNSSPFPSSLCSFKRKSLSSFLNKIKESYFNNFQFLLLQRNLLTYIPLYCSNSYKDEKQFLLEDKVKEFLSQHSSRKILLLHGFAGSGKTLFGRWLELYLWKLFIHDNNKSIIPIFVQLSSLKDPYYNLIEESLLSHGFTLKQINKLLHDSNVSQRVLFILDGFDEIYCKQSLYDGNRFGEYQNFKVIITSRSEYLFTLGNYLSYFGSTPNLQEYYIRPFSVNQRRLFFEKIVTEKLSVWNDPLKYEKYFNSIPDLTELIVTPYLLRIIADILPSLVDDDSNDDDSDDEDDGNNSNIESKESGNNVDLIIKEKEIDIKLTRSLIFETFTEQEFLKRRDQMKDKQINEIIIPEDFDEIESFRKFSMHLAVSMFVNRENTITTRGSDYRFKDEKNDKWDEFFSNSNPSLVASRFGSPLSYNGRNRSFNHKLLQEYFTASMLLRELSLLKDKTKLKTLSENYFNGRYLFEEPSIRDFLVEMIKSPLSLIKRYNCNWKEILLDIIEISKNNELPSIACGNAITLLLLLNYSFIERDLSYIHCSGAVFDYGDFTNVNFEGSVFKDCSWNGCCLNGCNFINSNFTNSNRIEERSSLSDSTSSITHLLNLNEKNILFSSSENGVSIWSKGLFLKRFYDMKSCDLYSSPNEQWILVSFDDKGYLFQSDNLNTFYYVIDNLNCIHDSIHLTNNKLIYGVKYEKDMKPRINLFQLLLNGNNNDLTVNDEKHNKIKINNKIEMTALMGVKVNNLSTLNLIIAYYIDIYNFSTLATFRYFPEKNMYQPLVSIKLTLLQFELIPNTSYVICWSTNHSPILLHTTISSIKKYEINNLKSIQTNNCCISHNGSSMLLGSFKEGYLFSIINDENYETENNYILNNGNIEVNTNTITTTNDNNNNNNNNDNNNDNTSLLITFNKLLQVDGMIGPFTCSQFSLDNQLVSVVCGSEIRIIKIKGCICMQVIRFHNMLKSVSFNQHDQELLIIEKNSNKIIRRKVDLKEDFPNIIQNNINFTSPTELSCIGSNLIGVKGLSIEDIALFIERGGVFVLENDLINQYKNYSDEENQDNIDVNDVNIINTVNDNTELKKYIFREALRSKYQQFIKLLLLDERQKEFIKRIMHEVVSLEYFDGSYIDYLLYLDDERISIVERDENGDTLFMKLSRKGHLKTLEKLINQWRPDINMINTKGESCLYIASENGHESICKLLISKGANINQVSYNGDTPLLIASQNGHKSVCSLLLLNGANANQSNNDDITPLHVAAENGHESICELLLTYRAIIEKSNKYKVTPLWIASQNGHTSICLLLLNNGANVNQTNNDGATPLYIAALNGHESICKLLLIKGANINQSNKNSTSPLWVASSNGHELVCQLLIKNGANINQQNNGGYSPLLIASFEGHESICKLLLDNGAEVNQTNIDGVTPLWIASSNGHESICLLLLNKGAEVNQTDIDGITPLYIACQNGHESICSLLLSNGANVNQTNKNNITPLYIASFEGHESICKILLNHRANVNEANQNGITPLLTASENGHESICLLLLNYGANVNQTDIDGYTSLFIASQNGYQSICKLLLDHKANINEANKNTITPLWIASENGHELVCSLLLDNGAEVNQTNIEGYTPLWIASSNGHESICLLLLNKGAEVNQTDIDGITPLYIACQNGHESVCKLLLSKGANIHRTNKIGNTPLYIACKNGHESICSLLISKGANINQVNYNGHTPFYIASFEGHESICRLLIYKGAIVNQQADKDSIIPLYCF